MQSAEDANLEIELKLSFPPASRSAIERHQALRNGAATSPKRVHQVSTYYDTSDLALFRAGLSLRVRSAGGRRIQTLKSTGTGSLVSRGEWEWALLANRPDLNLLCGTPAASFASHSVAPVVVTNIQRTAHRIELACGTVIEAAVDEGMIRAGDQEEPVHELELELKSGVPSSLFQLALALQADLPLTLSPDAKSARGYRLLTNDMPAAQKMSAPGLPPDVTVAAGGRKVMTAALAALLANMPAASAGNAEGVHQMRIAVRRLRTGMLLFKPHLDPAIVAKFDNELRHLGQVLGEARDWDVFTLQTLPVALDDTLRPNLADAAEEQRRAALQRLRQVFAAPEFTRLILDIAAWAEGDALIPDATISKAKLADLAPPLLDRLARKVRKRGRHIRKLSLPELHDVRKSMKKLRYAADDLAPLFKKKRVKAFRKHCTDMQDELGSANDAVMAATLSAALNTDGAPRRAEATVATTAWAQRKQRKALHRLPRGWSEFREATPFWH